MIVDSQNRPVRTHHSNPMTEYMSPSMNLMFTYSCNWFKQSLSKYVIPLFARQYDISTQSIQKCKGLHSEQCWRSFRNFNDFFTRCRTNLPLPLPRSREVFSPTDAYTVYLTNYSLRHRVWIKHDRFSIQDIFPKSVLPSSFHLFLFRLAIHHYHRVHSPVSGIIRRIYTIGQEYYSVQPNLIRSERVNVLKQNLRTIIEIQPTYSEQSVYLALIGATCVGSIHLHIQPNDRVSAKQEIGFFQLGGSCVVVLCPKYNFHSNTLTERIHTNTHSNIETELEMGTSLLHIQT